MKGLSMKRHLNALESHARNYAHGFSGPGVS
jgi:hypothetical protein